MKAKVKDESIQMSQLRGKHVLLAVAVTAIILISAVVVLYSFSNQPGLPKAAIIDELSSSTLYNSSRYVNDTFVNTTRTKLLERFPEVDYYRDNATVDQYRLLPSKGYKLIVWRAHSALDNVSKYIAITTSETYVSESYNSYFDNNQLTLTMISGDPKRYIAITPKFVEEVMTGRFEDTVIVFMSCNGLKAGYSATAEAFKAKGVKVFISWDGWINTDDNDNSITRLLDYLISQNNTVGQAVGRFPTPTFTYLDGPSSLCYYPNNSDAANYIIPNYKANVTANISGLLAIPVTSRKIIRPD